MPSMLVSNMQAAVAGAGNVDVQPAAGQAYLIREVGSDVVFVTNVPDIQTSIRDAVLADAIVQVDPTTDPGKRTRPLELYITNGNYLRITNTAVGAANLSWFGERVDPNMVITDIQAIGAGATVNIQPPAGQTWRLTEIGSDSWTGAGDINPNLTIGITDGTLVASILLQPTMLRGQDKRLDLIINNTLYLAVTDTGAAGCVVGYSGIIVPLTSIGSIQDVAGAAVLDILPPATAEWVLTEFAAEQWGGAGAPNDYPDISVSMIVGANLSEVLEAGSVATSLGWNRELKLHIDNTHYVRITNVNVAANEVGVLGFLRRQYS